MKPETAVVVMKQPYAGPHGSAIAGQVVRMLANRAAELVKIGAADYAKPHPSTGQMPDVHVMFHECIGWEPDEPPAGASESKESASPPAAEVRHAEIPAGPKESRTASPGRTSATEADGLHHPEPQPNA